MNRLLQLNKKLLLFILFGISLIFIFVITLNKTESSFNEILINEEDTTDTIFDIINPSFTINNNNEKISVKAKKGNFIGEDTILLKNNVVFQSSQFKLISNMAIFNQKNQTAESTETSEFQSEGTYILSEGFKITKNGDIILFNGKTILILDK